MVENRTFGRNRSQSFVPYGDNAALQRVNDSTVSTNQLAVSGETVTFSGGAAGKTGVVALDVAPVYNSTGSELGHYTSGSDNDTSFAWVTGTVLTTQVKWRDDLTDTEQLATLSNGEFALNHDTGKIRYCKATTGTSDTCNYTTRMMNIDVTGSSVTASQNVSQLNGNTIAVDNGASSTGTQRVTLASDGTGVIKVWDGTNQMPTMDASARRGYVQITDGTTSVDVTTSNEMEVATVHKNKPTITSATGAAGITTTTAISAAFKLNSVTVHLSAAPTTSEDFTVTIDANDGAAYDTVIYRVDPSVSSATDIVYIPEQELLLESGDEILLGYANTDTVTYGVRIVTEAL